MVTKHCRRWPWKDKRCLYMLMPLPFPCLVTSRRPNSSPQPPSRLVFVCTPQDLCVQTVYAAHSQYN